MALTQERIDEVFSALRTIHKAHWRKPTLEIAEREIKRVGRFVFRIGSSPWVADISFSSDGSVEYIVNQELPERMRKHTEEMKAQFDKTISDASSSS